MRKAIVAASVIMWASLGSGMPMPVHASERPAPSAIGSIDAQGADVMPSQERQFKTLYSNFRRDKTARWTFEGLGVSGPEHPDGRQFIAFPFEVRYDSILRRVELALLWIQGPNAFTVSLRADAAGVPGDVLHTFQSTDAPPADPPCCAFFKAATAGVALSAGTIYWIVAKADGASAGEWDFNNIGDIAPYAWKQEGGDWTPGGIGARGAMRLLGTKQADGNASPD